MKNEKEHSPVNGYLMLFVIIILIVPPVSGWSMV